MSRDHKPVPEHEEGEVPEGEGEGERHAADEPTAVWDEGALRAAGLGDLLHRRMPDAPNSPATQGSKTADPSIVVDESMTASPVEVHPAARGPRSPVPRGREPGWASTLIIAIGLGALVYLAIRLFRG